MPSADNAKTESYARDAARQAPSSCEVSVLAGADAGSILHVDRSDPSRLLVGTSPACSLRLTDRRVSRRHAALEPVGEHLQLTDLDSTNGTYVNGARIVSVLLVGGERIVMGDSELAVAPSQAVVAPRTSAAVRFGRVMGSSEAMRRLYPVCERLARSTVPILIEGETGTGKELLAESLHEQSRRAQGPFVVFDCSTISPNLLEAKLFGHERGAFTGASSARKGVFELAHGGTIFIDEIGDLDVSLQARLLRAIERGEVARVGSERWTRMDTRVITATRRDLDRAVQEGTFRDDLFFRLAVGRVELPPLRSRHGDILMLAFHFWREAAGGDPFPPHLLARFERYHWPGNVRELQNTVARIHALGDLAEPVEFEPSPDGKALDIDDGFVAEILQRDLPLSHAKQELARRFEPLYLARALQRAGGNVAKAAAQSGVARRYFSLLVARHRE